MISSENDNIAYITEKIDVIIEAIFSSEDLTKLDYINKMVLDIDNNVPGYIVDNISKHITVELLDKHQMNSSHLISIRDGIIQYIKDILIVNEALDDASTVSSDIDYNERTHRFFNEITYMDNVTKDDESININVNKVGKSRSIAVIRDIIVGNSCEQNFPVPARVWTRGERQCYPFRLYSKSTIDMRRKVEILKYANNNINLSKKHQYAMLAKGHLRKKKSWATQTATTTDCNTRSLPVSGRIGSKTPDGTILICNNGQTNCASTTASDVPGPPMELCYQKEVPLANYKVKRTYLTDVVKWPQTKWQPGDLGFPRGKSGSG